jgi:hypothetical protein
LDILGQAERFEPIRNLLHRGHQGPVAACPSFSLTTIDRLHQKRARKHVPTRVEPRLKGRDGIMDLIAAFLFTFAGTAISRVNNPP